MLCSVGYNHLVGSVHSRTVAHQLGQVWCDRHVLCMEHAHAAETGAAMI